ncbi:MAG: hypothetical protein U1F10_08515 [Burkholderiales bacterium]
MAGSHSRSQRAAAKARFHHTVNLIVLEVADQLLERAERDGRAAALAWLDATLAIDAARIAARSDNRQVPR